MGYTTEFVGEFDIVGKEYGDLQIASTPVVSILSKLSIADIRELPRNDKKEICINNADGIQILCFTPPPYSCYCDWELTEDHMHIKWNGTEKFYDYVEWLQIIIDKILLPHGLTLSGEVKFQGEDAKDRGILLIAYNRVIVLKNDCIPKTQEEYSEFYEFVNRRFPEVIDEWLDFTR